MRLSSSPCNTRVRDERLHPKMFSRSERGLDDPGSLFPDGVIYTPEGTPVRVSDLWKKKPLVVENRKPTLSRV